MRLNEPVTQREVRLPPGRTLLSTTDPDSRITYANGAFVEISGFTREELMGQPHNLVRHPDMPVEAFADMWRTLKSGQPWSALVKNRRKDGDHYWVRANATAVRRGERLMGYMSVRTAATEREIAQAESLYARFRAGRTRGLAFERGLVVHTGLGRWRSTCQLLPLGLRTGLAALLGAAPVTLVAGGLVAGSHGTPGLLAVLAASAVGLAAAAWWLRRQVVLPVRQVLTQALAVASGQPVDPVPMNRADEVGVLMRAVNQAGLNLRALVDDVTEQADGVDAASRDVAAGSRDLSERTEQSAAGLQQTAATIEQLSGTLQRNADAAHEVSALSVAARAVAQQGGDAMKAVVAHMSEIGQSGRKVVDIVGLIDDIAFQTNILALNAAVEAARAGEQGRGFTVVAAEVRRLAQRAAEAARDIKTLIQASMDAIEDGGERVEAAGGTMDQLVQQVERVNLLIGEMSRACAEQAGGVTEVCASVAAMDRSTQQNAALVQQSAAAAGSLSQRAGRLAEAVGVFAAS